MLRLLYIATNLNTSGGVARVLSIKTNYLVNEYFYNIHIINTHGDTDNLFYDFNERISIHKLQQESSILYRAYSYSKILNDKIKAINPDIIINCDNGLKGSLLPFFYTGKVPLIFENHGSNNVKDYSIIGTLKLRIRDLFFKLGVKRYSKIVVFRHFENTWHSNNIKVIHNPLGFNVPIESTSFNEKTVLAVGRISYEKGYNQLIKIWGLVIKKRPDWQLHIYGEGDCKSLQKQIQKLQISDSILFFKPTLNIKEVYLNASIFLNTSRYESFGMALIEAMACGLPVLAFEHTDGPKIYIKNKENGFLLKKDNLQAYANQVISLMDDKIEMKRIGDNAKRSVSKFKIDTIIKQWHELFQTI